MRRVIATAAAVSLVAAVPAIAGSGDGGKRLFRGETSEGGNVQFKVSKSGERVVRFRFASRCPADSKRGTLVPGRFEIRRGKRFFKFSHKDSQFTIKGRFVSGSKARGTAQNVTGNCNSGKLKWTATARD